MWRRPTCIPFELQAPGNFIRPKHMDGGNAQIAAIPDRLNSILKRTMKP